MTNSRQFKLVRDSRPSNSETIASGTTVAAYSTLAAAVAGARKYYARIPDSSLCIIHDGAVVRCLAVHGVPTDARWRRSA